MADSFISDLQPQLPTSWKSLPQAKRQQAMDRAKNLLQVRRNLLELTAGQRKARGLIMQHEANAEQIAERLETEGECLPAHRVKHLNGRLAVHRAEVEKQVELIEQYQLEIDLYKQLLLGNTENGNG